MKKLQKYSRPSILLITGVLIGSCNSKPTVVEAVKTESTPTSAASSDNMESHKVKVDEVLQTKKYSYLRVTEGTSNYWIAISKADVSVGETCVYTGGLKMHGFKSTELDRIFEELLLVSNISRAGDSGSKSLFESMAQDEPIENPTASQKIVPVKGAIKIGELLANPKKYEGKEIIVTGRCTKINHQIMGRNWIHIEDGSGKNKELTITSQDVLKPGEVGVFEGTVSLDKDFGAGYRYELILENAKLK